MKNPEPLSFSRSISPDGMPTPKEVDLLYAGKLFHLSETDQSLLAQIKRVEQDLGNLEIYSTRNSDSEGKMRAERNSKLS